MKTESKIIDARDLSMRERFQDNKFWDKYEKVNGGYSVDNFGTGRHLLEIACTDILGTDFLLDTKEHRDIMRKTIQKARQHDFENLLAHLSESHLGLLPNGTEIKIADYEERTNLGTIINKEWKYINFMEKNLYCKLRKRTDGIINEVPSNIEHIASQDVSLVVITPEELKEANGSNHHKYDAYLILSKKRFERMTPKLINKLEEIYNPKSQHLKSFRDKDKNQFKIDRETFIHAFLEYHREGLTSSIDFQDFLFGYPPKEFLRDNFKYLKDNDLEIMGSFWDQIYGDPLTIDNARFTLIPVTPKSMKYWLGNDLKSGKMGEYADRSNGIVYKYASKEEDMSRTFGMNGLIYTNPEASYAEGKVMAPIDKGIEQLGSRLNPLKIPHPNYSLKGDKRAAKLSVEIPELARFENNLSSVLPQSKRFQEFKESYRNKLS